MGQDYYLLRRDDSIIRKAGISRFLPKQNRIRHYSSRCLRKKGRNITPRFRTVLDVGLYVVIV